MGSPFFKQSNMKTKISLLLIWSLLSLKIGAADYVDDINNATVKNEAGHQVIYEMNIGMFTQAGTFAAAQARLPELKQLGIDIVWLMPIYERGTSGSPYAVKNFKNVNPKYGTTADLKAFVAAAHELGMEVWLDWVPNHTATNADWVTTNPDYYAKAGGQMIHPNNYNDVWQLNYANSELVDAMNNCLKFWIDQADIDGYRCDYVSSSYIPASYWQITIPMIKSYKSGKTITFLGEADFVKDATSLQNVGFDYDYAWNFQGTLATYGANGTYSASLRVNANNLFNDSKDKSFTRMLYLTNHDQNFNDGGKTLTQLYGNNRYPLAVLVGTLYGMPLIYNGQETGGNQVLDYFNDTKINWSTRDAKMRNTLRTLNAMKHAVPALADRTDVNLITISGNTNVLAFTRTDGDSEVLVLLNMATTASTASITGLDAGAWSQWLTSETISQGTSRQQMNFSATQSFTLEAKGYRVFVKGTYPEADIPAPEVYTPILATEDEISIFFETATEREYAVWAWGDLGGGEAYQTNTSWPGDAMTLMGQTASGHYIYKYTFTKVNDAPAYLIISYNGGNTKIYDGVAFVNHGYYVEGNSTPTQIITATGIREIVNRKSVIGKCYDLSGRKVATEEGSSLFHSSLKKGIYIQGGKKYIIK